MTSSINSHCLIFNSSPSPHLNVAQQAPQGISLEKELQLILKKIRSTEIPELKKLQRIATIISYCKSAAFDLMTFLLNTSFRDMKVWLKMIN